MPTKVLPSDSFKKELRRLAHKFPLVVDEIQVLYEVLESDERPGDSIPNVGYVTYKVRLKNLSANKGKSSGFRVIYYVYTDEIVILLTVYSKTDQENISSKNIQKKIENESPLFDEGDENQ